MIPAISKKNTKIYVTFLLFILFILLDFSYRTFLSVYLASWNYVFEPSLWKAVLAYLILAIFLYVFYVAPTTDFMLFVNTMVLTWFVVAALVFFKNHPDYTVDILFFNLLFAALMLFIADKKIKLPQITVNSKTVYYLLLALAVISSLYFIFRLGQVIIDLNPANFLKEKAHVRHSLFSDFSKLSMYIFSWTIKVFIPLSIIKSVRYKQWYVTFGLIALTVVLYAVTNVRFIFFSGITVLFFALLKNFRISALSLALIFAFSGIAGIFLRYTINQPVLESLILRRYIMVPQLHNIAYFELFRDFHLHLSYSILSFLEKYPLNMRPAHWVGEVFYHRHGLSANNGFISQGFMDFGYAGIIIYSLTVVAIFVFLNSMDFSAEYAGLIFLFMSSIVSSSITTVMVTHGGFILLFFLYFFAEKQNNYFFTKSSILRPI